MNLPGDAASTTDLAASRPDTLFVEAEGGLPTEFRLFTHFQPIFSLAHRRPVGYEGLIRGTDSNGKAYLATELLAKAPRSEEHTSELQSQSNLVCRLLLEKK